MTLPMRNQTGLQDLGNGVSLEWLKDGKIIYFSLESSEQKTVDMWFDSMKEIADSWSLDEPLLFVHDTRKIGLTPYLKDRGNDITRYVSAFRGRFAIVVPQTALAMVMKLYVERETKRASNTRERRVFSDLDQAIAWVAEAVEN